MADSDLPRTKQDEKGIFTAVLENDIFAGEDNGYTNGFRFSYLSPETNPPKTIQYLADQLPFFTQKGYKRWHASFGQAMYAPDDLTRRNIVPTDRPYAGFLYGSLGMLTDTGHRLDNLQLTLGIVGPASGAKQTQKFVHRLIADTDPQGWSNQLHNELGFILTYERKWRNIYQLSPFGLGVDITPHAGASAGNVDTHASLGTMLRFGRDLPADYGPPVMRPNLPGSDFFMPTQTLGWYLFTGIEARAVARNIFLDGNSFRDSHSVDKKRWVGGVQAGIAVTYRSTRIAYTHILRTREYTTQDTHEEFGAFTISQRF
jgi:lipid A 3-O-deacylase